MPATKDLTDFVKLAKITEIPAGEVRTFDYEDLSIAICNIEGAFYAIDNVCTQVEQDMLIWNYKHYQPNPILCDGDGPINQFRKWFAQFYVENK